MKRCLSPERATAAGLTAGVGLKPKHASDIATDPGCVTWFEVHAENYMGAGGPSHAFLTAVAARFPLSLHGVGASLGADICPNRDHLKRLRRLVDRYQPVLFSEHLAWSTHDGRFLNDLLPPAYDDATLKRVSAHVDALQEAIGRKMLLENPATYLAHSSSAIDEIDFITEVSRRTGCGLLLDINNVYVSAANHRFDPRKYLARFPFDRVGEVHLAGHARDSDEDGSLILIDAHDRPVDDAVWALFAESLPQVSGVPVLIEWDDPVPAWSELAAEAARADALMRAASLAEPRHAA
ncbi:MAG TPA: DUF692 domain-containing protein [Micropepsaceae bacterium]|nr:DUF692 domain-containing protein [Micropepsaceae bacterium]